MGNHPTKPFKIAGRKVQIHKQIAEGGFSFVYLVKDLHSGSYYALKRVLYSYQDELRVIEKEIEIHRALSGHRNVVTLIGSLVDTQSSTHQVLMLQEYCPDSLTNLMQSRIHRRFSESELLNIFSEICQSILHMHSQRPPIAHRDLKVENILISDRGIYKLCDFGSATVQSIRPTTKKEISDVEADIQRHTTLAYRAPEMVDLFQHRPISHKADVWALGCILYRLAYFEMPFAESTLKIISGSFSFPSEPNYSSNLQELLRRIFVVDPDLRPSVSEVISMVTLISSGSPLLPTPSSPVSARATHPPPVTTPPPVTPVKPPPQIIVTPQTPQTLQTLPMPICATPQHSSFSTSNQNSAPIEHSLKLPHSPSDLPAPPSSASRRNRSHRSTDNSLSDHESNQPSSYNTTPVPSVSIQQDIDSSSLKFMQMNVTPQPPQMPPPRDQTTPNQPTSNEQIPSTQNLPSSFFSFFDDSNFDTFSPPTTNTPPPQTVPPSTPSVEQPRRLVCVHSSYPLTHFHQESDFINPTPSNTECTLTVPHSRNVPR
ncbi:AP2-associated protein kinase 1 [Pelomyxa schiedti]|nr:AP2-associated protein kinase 1 [Pelomyxa schiedti]